MEKLYITNGSKLAPINRLQLVPSLCAQPKSGISKDIQIGHRPACDKVKRDDGKRHKTWIRYSYTPEYQPESRDKCVTNHL